MKRSGLLQVVGNVASGGVFGEKPKVVSLSDIDLNKAFADLQIPGSTDQGTTYSTPGNVELAISQYSNLLADSLKSLQGVDQPDKITSVLDSATSFIDKAYAVPTYGKELGLTFSDTIRHSGGLDLIIENSDNKDEHLQFSSARLLEHTLTSQNRSYVIEHGLEKVVNGARLCTQTLDADHARVGTGILGNLFKHSEETCSEVIRLGGLDAVLYECRSNDIETLRNCAMALANLALYGGDNNEESIIAKNVPKWLFPLAFHTDERVKYYACLASAVLVANNEIEAEVVESGTLDLIRSLVTSHKPSDFAKSILANYGHSESKFWLQHLVPVLNSTREEARNLAAFHFSMEAGLRKEQGNTNIFSEIGAIEPLVAVAGSPNPIASKFASQALQSLGKKVPHKLSRQVPLWLVKDVRAWVKQIGFSDYEKNFTDSRVDGDLLLKLKEENLREDLGVGNGIERQRFWRELSELKILADYNPKDAEKLNEYLKKIDDEFSIYTYALLNAGVKKKYLKSLTDDQLLFEIGVTNSIHRHHILTAIKNIESSESGGEDDNKPMDVFISYRRSNGSHLASLLKVYLQLRGFTVFLDVERLESGRFDLNLLKSIRDSKNFVLVLSPNALDRCMGDDEGKDWVHKVICITHLHNTDKKKWF